MPCDSNIPVGMTVEQRQKTILDAIKKLEAALASNKVQAVVSAKGAVAFKGWNDKDRDGVTDICAYRRLAVENSYALKVAIQKAELLAGTKVNLQTIGAGTHSHDGGKTWSEHK